MRSVRSSLSCRSLEAGVIGAMSLMPVTASEATVVRFDTDQGVIDMTLYDALAPATVANFLNYVTSTRYDGTFVHRSAVTQLGDPFVIQGGGFTYDEVSNTAPGISLDPPVVNEFGLSNTRRTVAMARQGGAVNSATSQWFVNMGDNSFLDTVDEGFTVFGAVMGDTMDVVDNIAALPRFNLGGAPFNEVPLEDNGATPLAQSLVFVNSATVLNLLEGDANMDNAVGQDDLNAVLLNWGASGARWDTGDFNGDATVGQDDLNAVLLNWGSTLAEPGSTSVPEPGSLALMALTGAALVRRSRG